MPFQQVATISPGGDNLTSPSTTSPRMQFLRQVQIVTKYAPGEA